MMLTPRFGHLAQRVFNRPVAILPHKAEMIVAALSARFGVNFQGPKISADVFGGEGDIFGPSYDPDDPGYDITAGVAVISVSGTLTHRLGCLRPYSGMTGYDGLRTAFIAAMNDEAVTAIVFDIDSPGGEVAGLFDFTDMIFAARGNKPIWAILDECAFSAAYAIAAACDVITVPRTGGTGSIGVVCMHIDVSQMLSNEGIVPTLIQFGAQKTDFSEFKPLAADALARMQAEIDSVGEIFVGAVARYRDLSPAAVKATQAGVYLGQLGVDAGLADEVMAPDAAFSALIEHIS